MELAEGTNTDRLAEVDVAGKSSGTDVEPVWVVRGLLLVGAGLDDVNPCGDLDLACSDERDIQSAYHSM